MHRLTPLLTIGLLVAFSLANPCHGALIAHWSGDNTADDATVNDHDGVASGVSYTSGVLGDAFSFNGTGGSVIVPASTALEPVPFSVSLWVQSALENHLRLLVDSTHGVGQAGWALQINSANNISFAYGNGSTFPELTSGAGVLSDGEFHHLVATFDGSTMQMFIDGGLPATLAYSGVAAPSGRDIQIGNSLPLNRPHEGALDEIRIYDHVLSPAEIATLASVPEPATACLLSLAAFTLVSLRLRRRSPRC